MKVNEVIQLLQRKSPIYNVVLANEYIHDKVEKVADNLDLDDDFIQYALGTNVYKCEDGYVGIRGVCKIYDTTVESSKDFGVECTIKEYVPIPTITYKEK